MRLPVPTLQRPPSVGPSSIQSHDAAYVAVRLSGFGRFATWLRGVGRDQGWLEPHHFNIDKPIKHRSTYRRNMLLLLTTLSSAPLALAVDSMCSPIKVAAHQRTVAVHRDQSTSGHTYRSISPNTTSKVPIMVTTSANIAPVATSFSICRWAYLRK